MKKSSSRRASSASWAWTWTTRHESASTRCATQPCRTSASTSSSSSAGWLMRTARAIDPVFEDSALARRDDRLVLSANSSSTRLQATSQPEDMRNLVDLASRRAGGIEVALIWNRSAKSLVVFAHDNRTDEEVAIPVTGDEASEVYRHPFAYAHRSLRAPDLPHAR